MDSVLSAADDKRVDDLQDEFYKIMHRITGGRDVAARAALIMAVSIARILERRGIIDIFEFHETIINTALMHEEGRETKNE